MQALVFWSITNLNQTSRAYIMTSIGPLCSHNPLEFASTPAQRSEMSPPAASRLHYVASWKLNTESARDEPKLRKLLGHISVFDQTRTLLQSQTPSSQDLESNELSTYLQEHVPSFRDFQAAIALQLATMAEVKAAASQHAEEEDNNSDEEEDDSDYDSHDEDWSDSDTAAGSDESYTDDEGSDGQWSSCTSPTSSSSEPEDCEEDQADLWAIRPLAPMIRNASVHF
nr:hypothetical protein LTR18_008800 [Exophiala xenobiotica]